jgi:hypothetical protein
MRKTLQRRPGFDALESMTLLSGLTGAGVATAAHNPIHLTGSMTIGTSIQSLKMALRQHSLNPAEKGSGSISPLGHVTGSGNGLSPFALATGAPSSGSFTLTAKTGKVFVSMIGLTPVDNGFGPIPQTTIIAAGKYTITGGTGAYAGETGSGTVQITVPVRGKFTAIFS